MKKLILIVLLSAGLRGQPWNQDILYETDSIVIFYYEPDTRYACIGKCRNSGFRFWTDNGKTYLEARMWRKWCSSDVDAAVKKWVSDGSTILPDGTDSTETTPSFFTEINIDYDDWTGFP